jgi:hypothetical protein
VAQKSREDFMQIDAGAGSEANKKEVRFDSLYDVLFNDQGQPKTEAALTKKVVISGDKINFLDAP